MDFGHSAQAAQPRRVAANSTSAPPRGDAPSDPGVIGGSAAGSLSDPSVVLAMALPVVVGVVGAIALAQLNYVPVGDEAAMVWRSKDVASMHPPLTGVYSTRGFSHPGPASVWFVWIVSLGGLLRGSAVFAAVSIVSGATVALAVHVAGRALGGRRAAWATSIVGMLALGGLGGDQIGQFWNPYPPILWFFVFVVASMAAASGHVSWMPLAVGSVSACVQAHVSFVLPAGAVVAALGVHAVVTSIRNPRAGAAAVDNHRSAYIGSLLVAVVFWLPVVADQLFRSRNLGAIVGYFTAPSRDTVGVSDGLGVANQVFEPFGPWAFRNFRIDLGGVATVGFPWVLVAVAAVAWASLGQRGYVRTIGLGLAAATVLTPVAIGGAEGFVFDYLVTSALALMVADVAYVAITVAQRVPARWRGRTWQRLIAAAAVLLAASVSARVAVGAELPGQIYAPDVIAVSNSIDEAFDDDVALVIDYSDDQIGIVGPGIIAAQLEHRNVGTHNGAVGYKWGRDQFARIRPEWQSIGLVIAYQGDPLSDENQCLLDNSGPVIVHYWNRTAAQRDEAFKIRIQTLAADGEISPGLAKRRRDIEQGAVEIAVVEDPNLERCRVQ